MGGQTRRVEFPVCGLPCWTSDNVAVNRGGAAESRWHPKSVHGLDFVKGIAKRGLAQLPFATCMTVARDSVAFLADASGTYQNFSEGNIACVMDIGADFQGSFTNKIRNPRFENAASGVIGSGGALWTYGLFVPGATGLQLEVKATGAEFGIPYCELRFFGTAAASSIVRVGFDESINAGAAAGQAWGSDFKAKLIAGTAPNVFVRLSVPGGNEISGPVTSLNGSKKNVSFSTVLTDAAASSVKASLGFSVTSGSAYDFTLRAYAPKLVRLSLIEGAEIISNGDFSGGSSGFTDFGFGYISVVAGEMKLDAGAGPTVNPVIRKSPSVAVTAGSAYKFSIAARRGTTASNAGVASSSFTTQFTSSVTNAPLAAFFVAPGSSFGFDMCILSSTASGTAYFDNASLKLQSPGYMPSFPILPPVGSPADSVRAADVAQTATFDWFANAGLDAGATELVAVTCSHTGDGQSRHLFEYSDGTANNYVRARINPSDRVEISIVTGGVLQTTTALTSPISAGNKAYGFSWSSTGGYVSNGSETVTFPAIAVPALSQKRIGCCIADAPYNDIIRQIQACTLLSSAEAVSWIASA